MAKLQGDAELRYPCPQADAREREEGSAGAWERVIVMLVLSIVSSIITSMTAMKIVSDIKNMAFNYDPQIRHSLNFMEYQVNWR